MRNPQRPVTLDHVDQQLLRALAEDAGVTNKALAGRLGLAESTCAYRIRALREAGVVTGARAQLDLALLGFPLQAMIKVRLGSHTMANVSQLYDALAATPGVLQAFHVAGADDFYLHVAVENAEALRDFVLRHVTSHRVVRQTETHLVFEVRPGAGVLRP
ncbi:Lrp/AsnC family transcriptional regulator [Actinoplanes sp. NPDC026670]|uniref:Lrp/AsnC family transcriptional regulator n=1 Tax=Actinoplanes sp. NPDC026670 TaxID=3154700 RepID=UPI0033EF373A